MKKIAPYIVLFVFAMVLWESMFDPSDMHFVFDGDEIDSPLGALLGGLIGLVVMAVVGIVLAVVFCGVGVLVVCALLIAALAVMAAVAPLLLPVLVPVAIIWYLASRHRRSDARQQTV